MTRKQLKAARRRKGLTQAEIADAIGRSRPLVSLIESGTVNLTAERAEAIAAAIERLSAARVQADEIMADAIRDARRAAR